MALEGFGDSGRTNPKGPKSFGDRAHQQPEIATVLSHLQADALEALNSPSGQYSSESKAVKRNGQLRVDTVSPSGQHDIMLLKTKNTVPGGNVFAPTFLNNVEIVSSEQGKVSVETTKVGTKLNRLDQLVDPGTGQLSIEQIDASGKTIRKFEPAVTKTRLDERYRDVRDQAGQLMRVTEPAGDRANCEVPYSGTNRSNYILRDQSIAKTLGASGDSVALEVTIREQQRRDERGKRLAELLDVKVIVRTLDGRMLATIDQEVTMNAKGVITYVDTKAKKTNK
jgi:hypothetical protein